MTDGPEALVLDLLPRPYAEVIEAWRTSCPRLPVWEEANERGFVVRSVRSSGQALVGISSCGARFLDAHRPRRVPA